MQALRKPSTRVIIAAITFASSLIMGAGQASAAASAYCNYADGWTYCGTEEFIYEGHPGHQDCLRRWEDAQRDCPLDLD